MATSTKSPRKSKLEVGGRPNRDPDPAPPYIGAESYTVEIPLGDHTRIFHALQQKETWLRNGDRDEAADSYAATMELLAEAFATARADFAASLSTATTDDNDAETPAPKKSRSKSAS